MQRKYFYWIKNYVFDIIASILAIILAWLAFTFSQDDQLALTLSVIVIIVFLFIIIYLRSRERDFYFIPLDGSGHKDDWIGNGIFEYSRIGKAFQITQADPGCIYSRCLNWSDYKFEFDFKIRKECLGVILHAVNLSNYVMLQITEKGIRPHLRINGGWNVWEIKDTGLSFDKDLAKKNWYRCSIVLDKNVINIKILYKKELIFDKEWIVPSGNIIFAFAKEPNDSNPITIPFPINLEYGSAGFRNASEEKALVKNILIEKI